MRCSLVNPSLFVFHASLILVIWLRCVVTTCVTLPGPTLFFFGPCNTSENATCRESKCLTFWPELAHPSLFSAVHFHDFHSREVLVFLFPIFCFTTSTARSSCSFIRVGLRVRPLTQKEQLSNCTECLSYVPNEPQILIGTDKSYTYDYVFDDKKDQEDLYRAAATPLLEKFIDG